MLFNSYLFIFIFFPLVLLSHRVILRSGVLFMILGFLIATSFVFYASWQPQNLFILCGSLIANYLIGRQISKGYHASYWLALGVAFNLLVLGWFKYRIFFFNTVMELLDNADRASTVSLPLAISFFTFQQIAFLVDLKRKELLLPGPMSFTAAVAFFPHLIAGPIIQYRDLLPQLLKLSPLSLSADRISRGFTLFTIGLAKKTLIADHIAPLADRLYVDVTGITGIDAWIGTLAYTLQLYFDFSAYCDMAVGIAWCMGITLPRNFDSPYQAASITDFWRRWHITLGAFLRDYLYRPLGGNRHGTPTTLMNLLVTMLLGGLWHGAAWTFVVWGGLHGALLAIHRLWRFSGIQLPGPLGIILTFSAVLLAWVLFRAPDLAHAGAVYHAMFDPAKDYWTILLYRREDIVGLLLLLVATIALPNTDRWVRDQLRIHFQPSLVLAIVVSSLFVGSILSIGDAKVFLYFNF